MLKSVIFQLKRRIPVVSILLIASCLFSTIPQFILSDKYSDITSQVATLQTLYLFTLSSFTHSPEILIYHLVGNLLVFVIFGVITEIIIGSKRFAIISIISLLSTTMINYLHTQGNYVGHGASGIAWGYHIIYIFILIVLFEIQGKRVFKDIYILFSILLLVFDIVGLPALEVIVLKMGFFHNFGQVIHLISMIVVLPFVLLWRADIEENIKLLVLRKPIINTISPKSISIVIIIALVLLNIFGTYKAITLAKDKESAILYEVIPEKGTPIEFIHQKVIVRFDHKIVNSQRILTSINSDVSLGEIEIKEIWIDDKTLEINFNREFYNSENIKLIYSIESKTDANNLIKEDLIIEYQ